MQTTIPPTRLFIVSFTVRGRLGFTANAVPEVFITTDVVTVIVLELKLRTGKTTNLVTDIVEDTTSASGIDVSFGTEAKIGATKETVLESIPMPTS